MAHIYQLDSGLWRAQIALAGFDRQSETFDTKKAAQIWASARETEMRASRRGEMPKKTVEDLLDRYLATVTPQKRGARWEELRIKAFKREKWVKKWLKDIDTPDFVRWRDERLVAVKPASIQRDLNLLKAAFAKARKEWKWMTHNPFEGMDDPGDSDPRGRLIYPLEVRKLCRAMGYGRRKVETKSQELAFALMVGLHTAMRQGEILRLTCEDIDLKARTIYIPQQKSGKKETIPITKPAARLLQWRVDQVKTGELFTLTSSSADALFRKYKTRVKLADINFHDSRATCLTRLASVRKVDVMTLARISRHSDIRLLMSTYYREGAASIASRL